MFVVNDKNFPLRRGKKEKKRGGKRRDATFFLVAFPRRGGKREKKKRKERECPGTKRVHPLNCGEKEIKKKTTSLYRYFFPFFLSRSSHFAEVPPPKKRKEKKRKKEGKGRKPIPPFSAFPPTQKKKKRKGEGGEGGKMCPMGQAPWHTNLFTRKKKRKSVAGLWVNLLKPSSANGHWMRKGKGKKKRKKQRRVGK